MVSANNVLYVGDGHNIYYSSDNGGTWASTDPDSGNPSRTVKDITVYGDDLYVAMSDGTNGKIRKYDVSTTTVSYTHLTLPTNREV